MEPVRVRSRAARIVNTAVGLLFLGIAIAGIFLLLVPTTINVLIAGFFLARGSERFDNWLVEHPILGPTIRDHRAGIGFTMRAKKIGFSMMSISIIGSTIWAMSQEAPVFVAWIMAVCWVWATWYIFKQPTKSADSVEVAV